MSLGISDLCFFYRSKPVLRGVSLCVDPGTLVGLVGPNGSGKTTLLKCVGNLHAPKSGSVQLDGLNLRQLPARSLAKIVGYVPQDTGAILPLSVIQTVLLGRTPYVRFGAKETDMDAVLNALEIMDLQSLAFRMTTELSGGERQRVVIARALAQEPRIMLLDEPTSSLDIKHQLEVLRIMRETASRQRLIVMLAIHDLNLAGRFCDRVVMLKDGAIVAQGRSSEVINAENIRKTYEVEAIVRIEQNMPFVMPLQVTK